MRRAYQCLDPKLQALCQRAVQYSNLQEKVIPFLPEAYQPHCQVGSYQQGTLVLTVQDPVWASQLRYVLPELRDSLRQNGFYQLINIEVQVLAKMQDKGMNTPKAKPATSKISKRAQQMIAEGSQSCSYEPLQQALAKLADRTMPGRMET